MGRTARLYECRGQRLDLRAMSAVSGFHPNTIYTRIHRLGMTPDQAISTPLTPKRTVRPPRPTALQMDYYRAIVAHIRRWQRSPTIKELMARFGVGSTAVTETLKRMEHYELIQIDRNKARGIRLAGRVPCPHCRGLGSVPAGEDQ